MLTAILLVLVSNLMTLGMQIWLMMKSYKTPIVVASIGEAERKNLDSLWDGMTQSAAEIIKVKPRGRIFMPPDELEEERQRIIANRAAQGLDTPIDLLREKQYDE